MLIEVLTTVGIAALRSFGGWLEHSLKDGQIQNFELEQLFSTIVRVSLVTGGLYFGVTAIFGIEVSALAASASAFILDKIIGAFKDARAWSQTVVCLLIGPRFRLIV